MNSGGRHNRLVDDLFTATRNRSEPFSLALAPEALAALRVGTDTERLAAHLFFGSVALQHAEIGTAEFHLESAEPMVASTPQPRMRCWYDYCRGWHALVEGRLEAAAAAFRSAMTIAQESADLVGEWERASGELLLSLRLQGSADAEVQALLQFLSEKSFGRPGRVFYQIVADALNWLGEPELVRDLRSRTMRVATLGGGPASADLREQARALLSLGDIEGAKEQVDALRDRLGDGTIEDQVATRGVIARYCQATGDLPGALRQLDELRDLPIPSFDAAETVLTVAEMYLTGGNLAEVDALVGAMQTNEVWPTSHWRLLSLQAELAHANGDRVGALDLIDRARAAASRLQPRADVMAMLRTELVPWVALADPASELPPSVDRRRAFRARWLTATARDIRRGMAPAALALHSNASLGAKVAALQESVDELALISGFLSDTGGAARAEVDDDFWEMHDVVAGLVSKKWATLEMNLQPGDDPGVSHRGLAGRMAFGLVAVIADQADVETGIELRVDNNQLVVEAWGLPEGAAQRLTGDLDLFQTPWPRPGQRVPPRASLLATFDAAASLGWAVDATTGEPGTLLVRVVFGASGPSGRVPVHGAADRERAESPDPQARSLGHHHVESVLWGAHRRIRGLANLLPECIEEARATGDPDLMAFAFLVGSVVAIDQEDWRRGGEFCEELKAVLDNQPDLVDRLLPDVESFHDCVFRLEQAQGNAEAMWEVAHKAVSSGRLDSPSDASSKSVYNWTQAELDRGSLRSAWRVASLCDPMGHSTFGRSLELGAYSQVLLAERRYEEALAVCQDRLALGRVSANFDWRDAVAHAARAYIGMGELDEALTVLSDPALPRSVANDGQLDALRALAMLGQGDYEAAAAALKVARSRTTPGYDVLTLSVLIPVEAEIQLLAGRPEDAAATLAAFPVSGHRLVDLEHRLDVERRVTGALGDPSRQFEVARQQLRLALATSRFDVGDQESRSEALKTLQVSAKRDEEQIALEQSKVASIVAHDVRNGLAAVALGLGLHRDSSDDFSERSELALQPVRTLADQLDAVASWGATARLPTIGPVSILPFLRSLQHPSQAVYEREGGYVGVVSSVPDDTALHVDGTMLQIIARNLIGNAIKHGGPGGLIIVSASIGEPTQQNAMGSVVTLRVEDSGPGLKPEHEKWLHRVRGSQWSPGGNLGLWIVRHYASLLGLRLQASTSPLGGARFDLVIPVVDQQLARRKPRDVGSGATFVSEGRASTSRVLVVEDDLLLSALIVDALEGADKVVTTASTAAMAIRAAEVDPPDFVLSDIELADGSTGFDVLSGLQGIGLNPDAVVMSGQSVQQTRIDALMSLGRELAFLQKPFSLDELYEAVG